MQPDSDDAEYKDGKRILPRVSSFDFPEEADPDASKTFKTVQLRLMMKERETTVMRLVELDFAIWALEEFFRGRDGP